MFDQIKNGCQLKSVDTTAVPVKSQGNGPKNILDLLRETLPERFQAMQPSDNEDDSDYDYDNADF